MDIFEMLISINELAKDLVNWKLLIFWKYHVNAKNIKCLLEWWRKHETMFSIVNFLTKQILKIVSSQSETEKKKSFPPGQQGPLELPYKTLPSALSIMQTTIFTNKRWVWSLDSSFQYQYWSWYQCWLVQVFSQVWVQVQIWV